MTTQAQNGSNEAALIQQETEGPDAGKKYITVDAACKRYDVSRSTIYRAFGSGELTRFGKTGMPRVGIEQGDRWMAESSA
ncbi:MAG: helix-turn-helix domain-containing protein [Rhodobacteraceae bacterium]|nr:helix-turn-helix domain-containing protein [Paracoccaceae bacterium]